ncbi:hypothetical protein EXIGLDRAFT_769441 [Exidia glandulosa HHB12029]|uniref:Uncharacterized protein n=1 Tax=Exidia glandulosa HHB12029 TaxID=1314781 RepID=A0A165HGN0_EXIGL|nr:hypothetical protein EXIGLDRAFT_769441 [Exidia glandulosa HHB12029]
MRTTSSSTAPSSTKSVSSTARLTPLEVDREQKHQPFKIADKAAAAYPRVKHVSLRDQRQVHQALPTRRSPTPPSLSPLTSNDTERQAIKDAGTISDFNVLHIITSPPSPLPSRTVSTRIAAISRSSAAILVVPSTSLSAQLALRCSPILVKTSDNRVIARFVKLYRTKTRTDILSDLPSTEKLERNNGNVTESLACGWTPATLSYHGCLIMLLYPHVLSHTSPLSDAAKVRLRTSVQSLAIVGEMVRVEGSVTLLPSLRKNPWIMSGFYP